VRLGDAHGPIRGLTRRTVTRKKAAAGLPPSAIPERDHVAPDVVEASSRLVASSDDMRHYFMRTERLGFGTWTADDLDLAMGLGGRQGHRLVGKSGRYSTSPAEPWVGCGEALPSPKRLISRESFPQSSQR
jgi:hypothetical protein